MKLFTKAIDSQLFAQYSKGNDLENQKVVAKIFNPYGRGTWYIINSDPNDPDYLWAIVDLFEVEVGSVSRTDLETIKVPPFRLNLERDIYFTPVNAAELLKGLMAGKRYEEGGQIDIAEQNKDMLLNYAEELEHHTEEFEEAAKKAENVEPWVVAKIERATTDLSDVTHYLDSENEKRREYGNGEGEEYKHGGKMEDGGRIMEKGDAVIYDDETYYITEKDGKVGLVSMRQSAAGSRPPIIDITKIDVEKEVTDMYGNKVIIPSKFEKGGELKWQNAYAGDSALVVSENKMGVILKAYGRKFHLKFPDGTEKTYDANDLKFFGDNDEYAEGGEMGVDKHRIYFSSLAEVIDAIYDIANENGYEVVDIFPDLTYGGISYGQTKKVKVELKWNGKEKVGKSKKRETNTLNVSIYRMDSGNYELVSYFAYKYGGKMARGGEIVTFPKRINEYVDKTNNKWVKEPFKIRKGQLIIYSHSPSASVEAKFLSKSGDKAKIEILNDYLPFTSRVEANYVSPMGRTQPANYLKKVSRGTIKTVSINSFEIVNEAFYRSHVKPISQWLKSPEFKEAFSHLDGKMASGGKVKFADKVKSIKSSLLKRKKVSPSVQKDYGKTYSPKEAEESAKRIVGAMTAKERLMKKRKK